MGIMTDDFNLLLKKNDSILSEVIDDLNKIKNHGVDIPSCITSNDLKFLNDKFVLEINQLNKALNKLNSYQKTLKSVYSGYKKQYEQVVIDSKKLMS